MDARSGIIAAVLAERWPRGATRTALLPFGAVLVVVGLFFASDPRMDWVTALGSAALVIWLVEGFPQTPSWTAWVITTAAGASYSFYLWHQDVIRYLVALGAGGRLLTVVAFITTAVIAVAIYHVIELPSMRLGRRIALRVQGWHPQWLETAAEGCENQQSRSRS